MKDLRYEYQAALGRYDLVLETGTIDLTLIEGTAEIDQRIRGVLRLMKGEWYLDTDQGVAYFNDVFKKGATPEQVGTAITSALLKLPDVLQILHMTVTPDPADRGNTPISFTAITTDGTFPIEEVI